MWCCLRCPPPLFFFSSLDRSFVNDALDGFSGKPANRLMYPCFVRVFAGPDPTRAKHAGRRFYMDWARSGSRFCETGEQGDLFLPADDWLKRVSLS